MKRPNIKETHKHSKLIYYSIFITSVIVLGIFSYLAYLAYSLTMGTKYLIIAIIIFSPVVAAIILMILLVYTGKRKFYRMVEESR